MIRERLRKLLGVQKYEIQFIEEEQKDSTLFSNKEVVEQFEIFLKNQILEAIRKRKFDKSVIIDEVYWEFVERREQAYDIAKNISELPASDQIKEVQKNVDIQQLY